jgi:hypothetical protein
MYAKTFQHVNFETDADVRPQALDNVDRQKPAGFVLTSGRNLMQKNVCAYIIAQRFA